MPAGLDIKADTYTTQELPPTRNDRPFCDNFVIWGPMKLVSGSNKSLGTYRFDEISTVALGQVLPIEKLVSLQNSRVKTETSGQRCCSACCNLM